MRKRGWMAAGVIMVLVCAQILTGCQNTEQKEEGKEPAEQTETIPAEDEGEEVVTQMMYLEFGRREPYHYLFADENGSLLDVSIPEDAVFDKEGNPMAADALEHGDLVDVYGNGMILESYPGQYPGVTKMQVAGKGDQEKAEQYVTDIYANIYSDPDPAELPTVGIQYTSDLAVAFVSGITAGSYDWEYVDYENERHQIQQDQGDISQWPELYQFEMPGEGQGSIAYEFQISPKPQEAELICYKEDGSREQVTLTPSKLGYQMEELLPGCTYELTARWEGNAYANGTVVYGFQTV